MKNPPNNNIQVLPDFIFHIFHYIAYLVKGEGVVGGELDVAVETGRVEEGRGGVDVGHGEAEGPLQEGVGLVENTA